MPVAKNFCHQSQHAVNSAREIQNVLNREIAKGNIPLTRTGIGIHTGDVVTGNICNHERQQYSVTGKVVILASRIEHLSKKFDGQFLVPDDVINSIDRSISSELMVIYFKRLVGASTYL